jgi:hypothetical protein
VVVALGLHRVDEAQLVDMLGRMGHQFANPHPGLPMLLEGKRTLENRIVATMENIRMACGIHRFSNRRRNRLAIELVEYRLVVEGVDLGWTADHEQKNHRLGSRCKMGNAGRMGSQRINISNAPTPRKSRSLTKQLGFKGRASHQPKTTTEPAKEIPSTSRMQRSSAVL